MTTVTVATLGCKVNQFESESLLSSLEQRGYSLSPFGEGADISIINTCTVTHRADFQSRQLVRRALRFNPKSSVIVTGCYAQVEPEAVAKIGGVRLLSGNQEKSQIPDLLPLIQKTKGQRVQVSDIRGELLFLDLPLPSFHRHTRGFLKIQDGCDAHCSYCIVPHARGRSRSLSIEKVLEHLRVLRERGFKEVVLTGIHIGTYGQDLNPSCSLEKLLKRLEREKTPERIRLSSVEPGDFSPGLISFLAKSTKVCPHLHIPIQSGEDEILQRMNRNYNLSLLFDLISDLHRTIPNLSIGADVIVGFPGETEVEFNRTYEKIESLPLSYLHVFPFSKRKGTPAYELAHQIDEAEKKRRAGVMRTLGKQKRQAFYGRFLQGELTVLVEGRKGVGNGRWKGFSPNYIPVILDDGGSAGGGTDWINQEVRVTLTRLTEDAVVGRVIER